MMNYTATTQPRTLDYALALSDQKVTLGINPGRKTSTNRYEPDVVDHSLIELESVYEKALGALESEPKIAPQEASPCVSVSINIQTSHKQRPWANTGHINPIALSQSSTYLITIDHEITNTTPANNNFVTRIARAKSIEQLCGILTIINTARTDMN